MAGLLRLLCVERYRIPTINRSAWDFSSGDLEKTFAIFYQPVTTKALFVLAGYGIVKFLKRDKELELELGIR
ncbi:MAG: hypothetical protein PHX21_03920 [bacterium]|nr:hypothetical protein [bacterium]